MWNYRSPKIGAAVVLAGCLSCSDGSQLSRTAGSGGSEDGETGGGGASSVGGGGASGVESGGVGGAPADDADAPGPDGADDAGEVADDAETTSDAPPPDPASYGKVGELVLVPLQYTAAPVPPIVAPECAGDPTAGFTEYQDSFVVQRPYDLAAADRFKYEDGIYTFWVFPNDKAHFPGNGTAPRTEARYSDMSTGEHIWSADLMFESPLNKTCVMQIHNVVGAIAVYLRVVDGRMFNLATGKTILTDYYDKWFNLTVSFDTETLEVNTYVNGCLKETSKAPKGTPYWYFKNGVYTCTSTICRDHYKNVHLYEKGSTDKYNVMSTYK